MKKYILFILLNIVLQADFLESIEVGLEGWNENSSGIYSDKNTIDLDNLDLQTEINPSFYIDIKTTNILNFKFLYSSISNSSTTNNLYESMFLDATIYSDIVKDYSTLGKYASLDIDLGLDIRHFDSKVNTTQGFSQTVPMGYLRAVLTSKDIDLGLLSQTLYSPIYGTNIDAKIALLYTFFDSISSEIGYRYNKTRVNDTYNANIITDGPYLGLSYRFNFSKEEKKESVLERKIIQEEAEVVSKIIILDQDKDGIIDKKDRCQNTQEGKSVNSDGCSDFQLDDDNDSVSNALDVCINTDANLSVDKNGCANNQIDSDKDTIMDDIDLCPNTPVGTDIDESGCEKIIISIAGFEDIKFEHGSTILTDKSKEILQRLAKDLKEHPNYNVNIEGHTSNSYRSWKQKKVPSSIKGEENIKRYLNTKISQKRADVVKKYLISIGAQESVIKSRGFGPDKPKASNDTAEGRAKNRRVEIIIDTLETK